MPRRLLLTVVLCGLCVAARAEPPHYKIEVSDRQTITATITYEIKTTNGTVVRWSAFLPEPPELAGQTKLKVTSEPPGNVVSEKSQLARKVRLLDVKLAMPTTGATLAMRLDIEATLRSRKLVPLGEGEKPPKVAALTEAEKKYYLAAHGLADFDAKPFADWLNAKGLRLGKREQPSDLATRVLEVLRTDYEYRFEAGADRKASVVCGRKATDCGGMSNLFVATMRANRIPARLLVGRLAKPRKADSKSTDPEYDQPHARAEFYLTGVGWVPVDPTYAVADKQKPAANFIGYDPGDLLVLHVGTDLRLPFPDQVRPTELLQVAPPCWATGRGMFDGILGPTGWELKAMPIDMR